jgi:hypothetical protein
MAPAVRATLATFGRLRQAMLIRWAYSRSRSTALGDQMSTFEGKRTIDGLVVTKDGTPLDEHYDVQRFTTWGFEWTYEGDSPQQLALAILVEQLGDRQRALHLCEAFMRRVIANLDNDWVLTSGEIEQAVAAIEARR